MAALQRLREWLTNKKVTHVVMESTGAYWIPVFNILEDHFVMKDAEHLADLLHHVTYDPATSHFGLP